ncbi:T9SS type A sorting domain-containing protein [Rhizosphaericola mali]|uniref:T9SS type A sorting domain-containing protein n=1 Tax=Rhizosphaericola mali TaxID=2545455 RepID=A0A5P2G9N6_9BACT|nr:T9SS type A sorting domain-containing protein [Rhizosphaericola mali]QES89923.1 T9SS type A sorting domain-containing protein [Rhizosphaericola mali]
MDILRNLHILSLRKILFFFCLLFCNSTVIAQTYYHTPLTNLTGFTKDIVASGSYSVTDNSSSVPRYTLNPNTESPFDYTSGAYGGYILYSTNYSLSSATAPTGGLPSSGLFASSWNSEAHNYKLQSYSTTNSLWLYHSGATGTLTFPTAQSYQDLYIMTIGGDGGGLVNITITYTDNTTSTTSLTGADWNGGPTSSTTTLGVISGYSALIRASSVSGETGNVKSGVTNQTVKFYESKILPTNTKSIKSILFTNANAGEMNILGVTGTPTYTVSGTVYSDSTNDNVANGIGSNTGAQYVVGTLNNTVISVATIASNGAYSFTGVPALAGSTAAYTLYLSTTSPAVGSTVSQSTLTSGWYDSTYVGSTGIGTTTNAKRYANVNASNLSSSTNLNFSIHNAPTSDTKTYTIASPTYSNTVKTMSSDVASGSTTNDLAQLTGVSIYPTSGTILNGNSSNRTVVITSLPSNGQLVYNGTAITTSNYSISNYDKTKLNFSFTGSGYTSTSFTYNLRDAIGFASRSNATYTINLPYPLPVSYTQELAASIVNKEVSLTWTTGAEINNKLFQIQRSADGSIWSDIGNVNSYYSNGTGSGHSYSFIDAAPLSGVNYYRLNQVDLDGTSHYGTIIQINYVYSSNTQTAIYPNPVVNELNIINLPTGATNIVIYSLGGKAILQKLVTGTAVQIGIDALPNAVYFVNILDKNGSKIKSLKFVKK